MMAKIIKLVGRFFIAAVLLSNISCSHSKSEAIQDPNKDRLMAQMPKSGDAYQQPTANAINSEYEKRIAGAKHIDLSLDSNLLKQFDRSFQQETQNTTIFEDEFSVDSVTIKENSSEIKDAEGVWITVIPNGCEAVYKIVKDEGIDQSSCIKYESRSDQMYNTYIYRNLKVQKNTEYKVTAYIKGDGNLAPVLSIQKKDWKWLAVATPAKGSEWSEISVRFNSEDNEIVMLKWFAGSKGKTSEGYKGASWLDNIKVELLNDSAGDKINISEYIIKDISPVAKVNPGIFGVVTLYNKENDVVRNQPGFYEALKWLSPNCLRYPGGALAENYQWKTNTIYRKDWGGTDVDKPEDYMNTDEYLEMADAIDAQTIMMLGYIQWVDKKDIEGMYKNAEDWVRYINIEKKKGIKYWELGNELYLKEITENRVQVTPEEYAAHYLELRKRLKAIDPEIQVGVPLSPRYNEYRPWDEKDWNQRVMRTTQNNIDFISIHTYYTETAQTFTYSGYTPIIKGVTGYRDTFKSLYNMDIPILITEWNVKQQNKQLHAGTIGQALAVGDGYMQMMRLGIEYATYWPMQWSVNEKTNPLASEEENGLISSTTFKPTKTGEVFRWFNTEFSECGILEFNTAFSTETMNKMAFLSPDKSTLKVLIMNRNPNKDEIVQLKLDGIKFKKDAVLTTMLSEEYLKTSAASYLDKNTVFNRQELSASDDNIYSFKMPQLSVAVLKISLQ